MKRGSTLILKTAVILIGAVVLALCIFLVPGIAEFAATLYPDFRVIRYLVFILMYGAAIPFYIGLFQAFNLLRFIDKDQAFSDLSVRALRVIKNCAFIISGFYFVGLPLFYLVAEKDDAPGVMLFGLTIIFASIVIAVFAAVLQRLLQEALEIKNENDLTI
jgi:hypothetical protein